MPNCVGDRIWRAGLCRGSNNVFGCIGAKIICVMRADSHRGTGLIRGKWHWFNTRVLGFKSCILTKAFVEYWSLRRLTGHVT